MKKFATIAGCISMFVLMSNIKLPAQDPFDLFDSLVQREQFPLLPYSGHPAAFVGYLNAYTRKSVTGNVYTLTIDYYVKNNGDSSWRMHQFDEGLKIYDANVLLKKSRFGPRKYPSQYRQGVSSPTLHDLQLLYIKPWNHTTPRCYRYSVEIFDKTNTPYQLLSEKIGFRALTQAGNVIRIDNKDVLFKAVAIHPQNIPANDTLAYLQSIKGHNFNTVVLKTRGSKVIFDLCDSIGLYIVQDASDMLFGSTLSMLEYLVNRKEHPSFIAWNDVGLNSNHLRILRMLDGHRGLVKFPAGSVVEHWEEMDSTARAVIKNKQQIFHFHVNTLASTLNITRDEYFSDEHNIALTWKIRENGVIVRQGMMDKLVFRAGAADVSLPFLGGEFERPGGQYEFGVVVAEGSNSYKKGEVIALSMFRCVSEDGRAVLQRLY